MLMRFTLESHPIYRELTIWLEKLPSSRGYKPSASR